MLVSDLFGIPSYAWAAILTPVIMWMFLRVGRKPVVQDPDGWTLVRPTIGLTLFGFLSLLFGLGFGVVAVVVFLVPADENSVWLLRALAPLLAALFLFGAYGILVARISFGGAGLRYRGLLRQLVVPWEDVIEIVDNSAIGVYVRSSRGRLFVWKYFRGLPQFVDQLKARGIRGADNPSLLRAP